MPYLGSATASLNAHTRPSGSLSSNSRSPLPDYRFFEARAGVLMIERLKAGVLHSLEQLVKSRDGNVNRRCVDICTTAAGVEHYLPVAEFEPVHAAVTALIDETDLLVPLSRGFGVRAEENDMVKACNHARRLPWCY